MEIIRRIPSKDASAVTVALNDIFSEIPKLQDTFKSITSDNGSEFRLSKKRSRNLLIVLPRPHNQ